MHGKSKKYVSLIVLLLVLPMFLTGCKFARDLTAKAVGAPTSQQIQASQNEIKAAQKQVATLQTKRDNADNKAAEARLAQQAQRDRASLIKSTIGQVAGQLATADGPAFDALSDTLERLRDQLNAVNNQVDEHAAIAARFASLTAEIDGAIATQNDTLNDAKLQLEGYDAATRKAISDASQGVQMAAEIASTLGVPGAKIAGDQVNNLLGWGLTVLLGTGATVAGIAAKKHKQRADGLTEVIVTNEELGFENVANDPAVKATARNRLSPNARRQFELARVDVRPAPAPGSTPGSIPANLALN